MQSIHVGIAYEGSADIEALKIIIQRVLNENGVDFDPDKVYPQTPGTGIIGFIPVYAKRFLDSGVQLAVYCTDQDKDRRSRRDIVLSKVAASEATLIDYSAIGVSVPHFEAWLIADENALKGIFDIAGSKSIPYPKLEPKDRLISLYQNHYSGEKSISDIRLVLASQINIGQVERLKNDFNLFVDDLRRVSNLLKR